MNKFHAATRLGFQTQTLKFSIRAAGKLANFRLRASEADTVLDSDYSVWSTCRDHMYMGVSKIRSILTVGYLYLV